MNEGLASCAIDASLWDEPTTGIGLYTRCLAEALGGLGVRVVRLGGRISGEYPRGRIGRSAFVLGPLPALLSGLEVPLYHAVANFNLPLLRPPGKRLVLTVHDLIPELLPETVSRAYRWQFRLWLWRSLRLADRIICVSACTRDDLLARFEVPPERVEVVYNGVDHVDRVPSPDTTSRAYLQALGLPDQYVLYAGALDARKNLGLLLEACVQLRSRGRPITLVLAGQSWFGSGPLERRVRALRAEGLDIRPLGYQSEPVFYQLMRRATVLAYPSCYEGFGLPPLEAMRLGVPVVICRAGALPEVCGEAAVQVGPHDALDLAEAIDRLLASPREREERARAGRERASSFTWRRAAEQTLEVYRRSAQRSPVDCWRPT